MHRHGLLSRIRCFAGIIARRADGCPDAASPQGERCRLPRQNLDQRRFHSSQVRSDAPIGGERSAQSGQAFRAKSSRSASDYWRISSGADSGHAAGRRGDTSINTQILRARATRPGLGLGSPPSPFPSLLIAPALWNGYPLLQWDTGGYLARWYEGYLVPEPLHRVRPLSASRRGIGLLDQSRFQALATLWILQTDPARARPGAAVSLSWRSACS